MFYDEKVELVPPNGYSFSNKVGPKGTDFGNFSTDIYVNLHNKHKNRGRSSQGFHLDFGSDEWIHVIGYIKSYVVTLFTYLYLGGVQGLSGFMFSLYRIASMLDDTIDVLNIFWKKLEYMYLSELLLPLATYIATVALIFAAYLWDCNRKGLFTHIPEYCDTVYHEIRTKYVTTFA